MSCLEMRELLAFRAVDCLEPDEAAALESHLETCGECRARTEARTELARILAEPHPDEARFAVSKAWARFDSECGKEPIEAEPAPPPVPDARLTIALTCSFCHDVLTRGDAVYCASCLAPHHGDCFRAHGRCSAFGCEETRTVRPRREEPVVAERRTNRRYVPMLVLALVSGAGAGGAIAALAGRSTEVRRAAPEPAPHEVAATEIVPAPVAPIDTDATPPAPEARASTPSEVRAAIQRGLAYLERSQDPATGAWREGIGRAVNNVYLSNDGPHVGVTALAGLSFLAANRQDPSHYGTTINSAVEFVLHCSSVPDGFIHSGDTHMYEHALATRFLAEVQQMAPRDDVAETLTSATWLIASAQNEHGGWRYLPGARDSDLSVTACVLEALLAARKSGVHVDQTVIDKAVTYVRRSSIRNVSYAQYKGGFWYQVDENRPFRPSRTSFAMTACGVAALSMSGAVPDEPRIFFPGAEESGKDEPVDPATAVHAGLGYLLNERNRPQAREMNTTFDYWYGYYQAAMAFSSASEETWNGWFPRVRDEIVAGQSAHGDHWEDLVGPNYATAMATLILQSSRPPK